jgi:hypothetical protein
VNKIKAALRKSPLHWVGWDASWRADAWRRLRGQIELESLAPHGLLCRSYSPWREAGGVSRSTAGQFEMAVNVKTAKTLGLTIPETFLVRGNPRRGHQT